MLDTWPSGGDARLIPAAWALADLQNEPQTESKAPGERGRPEASGERGHDEYHDDRDGTFLR